MSKTPTGCTRSHPHESMNRECELLTEIARLNNESVHLKAELAAARAEAFAECARICRERVPTEVPLLGHGAGATSVWPRIKGGDECARDIERAGRQP